MTATIYFTDREVAILDECGVAKLTKGAHKFTYAQAVELVEKMKRLNIGVAKYLQPSYRACLNSIRTAFGPDFWKLH